LKAVLRADRCSRDNPLLLRPTTLSPTIWARSPCTMQNGATSLATMDPPPSIAIGPTRVNWWMADKPPMTAPSPTWT